MDISNLDPDLAALLEDIPVAPSAPASPLDLFDDIGDDILLSASPQASGSLEPSAEDLTLTRRLYQAGNLLGIEVLDHIILSPNGEYMSFIEAGFPLI